MSYFKSLTASLSLSVFCAACGGVTQTSDTVLMEVQNGGTAINGTYRVGGFSQSQVRSMVGRICTSAGFSGFSQSSSGDLVTFTASCAAPTRYAFGADVRFVAQDDGTVDYFIVYTQNGRPLETGGNFRV